MRLHNDWSTVIKLRQLLLIRQGVAAGTAGTAVATAIEDALLRLSPAQLDSLYRRLVNV